MAKIQPNTRLDVTNDKKRAILCKQRNWSNSPRRKTPPIATKKHALQLNWIGYGPNKTLVDGLCRVRRSLWHEIKLHVRCRLGHAVHQLYSRYLKPSTDIAGTCRGFVLYTSDLHVNMTHLLFIQIVAFNLVNIYKRFRSYDFPNLKRFQF